MLEYQSIKQFLQKVLFQIGPRKGLSLKKIKILCHGDMLLVILMVNKLLEQFTKRIPKTYSKRLQSCKSNKEQKSVNYMLHGKSMIVLLIVVLIKKRQYK